MGPECLPGPGSGFSANGANVNNTPVGGSTIDPNGGYYYGRITYNF